MTKVLVTGANGYVGRHAVRLLAQQGLEVHAVTSHGEERRADGVAWHRADLFGEGSADALVGKVAPELLLHLAWYTAHGKYWTAAENFEWVRASLDLLRAFADRGGRRMVAAGSCAEYDWRFGWCSESLTPVAPASPYGVCKAALGSMAASLCASHGIGFAWGRIFHSYGPFEPEGRFVPGVIRSVLAGVPAACSEGTQIRDYLDVTDVAGAMVALLNSSVQGPVNIVSGVPRSLREIAQEIARQVGRPELLRFGARKAPAGDPPVLLGDAGRLLGEVGWRPSLSLEDGLRAAIAWWRSRAA